MLRTSRVLVQGGICHVYNRFASAEPVFVDPEQAPAFTERAMGSPSASRAFDHGTEDLPPIFLRHLCILPHLDSGASLRDLETRVFS